MNCKPIIIVWGEPNSVFSEIFIKTLNDYKSKKPLLLIGSKELFLSQIKSLKLKFKISLFNNVDDKKIILKKNKVNFINIHYNFNKPFEKISIKSNDYIKRCFHKAYEIISQIEVSGLINGPVSKKYFLRGKFEGITEMLTKKYNVKKYAMLIYQKSLSTSPVTTHLPIQKVSVRIKKKDITDKVILINKFYKKYFDLKPRIAVCGLNPHCENFHKKKNEEIKEIIPAISLLKKMQINVKGPFSSDTIFIKEVREKFDVIIGMYHDQVLAPIKSIYGFEAINVTLGLPFIRVSPDHGPNFNMIGKNQSNPVSLINSIKFLNHIN